MHGEMVEVETHGENRQEEWRDSMHGVSLVWLAIWAWLGRGVAITIGEIASGIAITVGDTAMQWIVQKARQARALG